MTTIVEVLQRAARQCSVVEPSSWVTTTQTEHVELRDDFMMETISDLQDRIDLPSPFSAQQTLTGDGSKTTFNLSSEFIRLHRDILAVYDNQQDIPVLPVTSDGMWTYLNDIGTTGSGNYYRVKGYLGQAEMDIFDTPASGDTFTISFVRTNFMIADGASGTGSAFTDEADIMLFPRRIIESGIVWRWRERRGLPYVDKYNEYEAQVARLANDTRGRRNINMEGSMKNTRWQDVVPAFIPAS